jgi:sulfite exporter TauE/SafE
MDWVDDGDPPRPLWVRILKVIGWTVLALVGACGLLIWWTEDSASFWSAARMVVSVAIVWVGLKEFVIAPLERRKRKRELHEAELRRLLMSIDRRLDQISRDR